MFAPLCIKDPPEVRRQRITSPASFKEAVNRLPQCLNSPSCAWLTILSLIDVPISPAELARFGELTNLVAVNITNTTSRAVSSIDVRSIRGWSEQAASNGSFARLRIMMFGNQDQLTSAVLPYLSAFPALTTFCTHSCSLNARDADKARAYGWIAKVE